MTIMLDKNDPNFQYVCRLMNIDHESEESILVVQEINESIRYYESSDIYKVPNELVLLMWCCRRYKREHCV